MYSFELENNICKSNIVYKIVVYVWNNNVILTC